MTKSRIDDPALFRFAVPANRFSWNGRGINFTGIVVVNNNAALSVQWATPLLWERSSWSNYGLQRGARLKWNEL